MKEKMADIMQYTLKGGSPFLTTVQELKKDLNSNNKC
jgi:hypothetical protein